MNQTNSYPNNPWIIHIPKSKKELIASGLTEVEVDEYVENWKSDVLDSLTADGFPFAVALDRVCLLTPEELVEEEEIRAREYQEYLEASATQTEPGYYTYGAEGLIFHPEDADLYNYRLYLQELLDTFEFSAEDRQTFVEMFDQMYRYVGPYIFNMFKTIDISEARKGHELFYLAMHASMEMHTSMGEHSYNIDDWNEFSNAYQVPETHSSVSKELQKHYGIVYVIEIGNHVKIGKSKKPVQRLQNIIAYAENYAHKEVGKILISPFCTNYSKLENYLHKHFEDWRLPSSELFNLTLSEFKQLLPNFKYKDNGHELEFKHLKSSEKFRNFLRNGWSTTPVTIVE